jgi:gamma-glutamyl:cysteine ligase YbdK (ATP-grasp superfamily)
MSNESPLSVRCAQRELRELADRLESIATVAGYACELSIAHSSPDGANGIEQYMRTVRERTKGVLHDLQSLFQLLEQMERKSD